MALAYYCHSSGLDQFIHSASAYALDVGLLHNGHRRFLGPAVRYSSNAGRYVPFLELGDLQVNRADAGYPTGGHGSRWGMWSALSNTRSGRMRYFNEKDPPVLRRVALGNRMASGTVIYA